LTWTHNGAIVKILPEDCIGYVYCITNTATGRKYIGKKLAKFSKTSYKVITQKNGVKKKKKIKSKVESDWQTYYGSNDVLNEDVNKLGKDKFTREILFYCNSKAQCSYIETRTQFERKVLESDEYYNGQISCKIHQSHIKGKI